MVGASRGNNECIQHLNRLRPVGELGDEKKRNGAKVILESCKNLATEKVDEIEESSLKGEYILDERS